MPEGAIRSPWIRLCLVSSLLRWAPMIQSCCPPVPSTGSHVSVACTSCFLYSGHPHPCLCCLLQQVFIDSPHFVSAKAVLGLPSTPWAHCYYLIHHILAIILVNFLGGADYSFLALQ